MRTDLSAEPAATFDPSQFHAALSKFFSELCEAPSKVFSSRFSGAKGLQSHIRTVLSIEFDKRLLPSGESASEVIAS
jgi:hypothetical protein